MRKLFLVVLAALALPGYAAAAPCALPESKPLWIDFGTPELAEVFGRPGLVLGVSSGDFPARMRAAGAQTVYWDMNLNNRVGTPSVPADPALIVDRANRLFDFAVGQMECDTPTIVLNELFGAHLETPWTATTARYRENVLVLLRQLAARGARPLLLVSTHPYTAGEPAAAWWREALQHSEVVLETYFNGVGIWRLGPIAGNRHMRTAMRRAVGSLTSIGIPTSKLGLALGFQTGKGAGGREGLQPDAQWYRVVKWQARAAREVAGEMKLASVVSWGWGSYNQSPDNADKPKAACVYLWARDPGARFCDGPAAAGRRFDADLREGQLTLPGGVQCTVNGNRITSGAVAALTRVTEDRAVAFTILLSRTVESFYKGVSPARVLAVERAVIRVRFGGSRGAYLAALRKANATVAVARAALGDELRRHDLARRTAAPVPAPSELRAFYSAYPDLLVRPIEAKPAPWWLGDRPRGLALVGLAPERVFSLPSGKETTVHGLEGSYKVTALDETMPLGSVPLARARPTISSALLTFARRAKFELWIADRQVYWLRLTTCRRDDLPQPGVVSLAGYLPFLSLDRD
jgi:hypothetical protein